MSVIKDRNAMIKSREGSTIHGAATYAEHGNTAIKEDTKGIGREYVKSSLESNVKAEIKNYSITAPAAVDSEKKVSRQNNIQNKEQNKNHYIPKPISSTQQRIYSSPESSVGSSSLSGAAAPATYVSTTNKVIKEDTKGIGREFIKNSLEDNVKSNLIKINGTSNGNVIAITENEKAIEKVRAAKNKGGADTGSDGSSAHKKSSRTKDFNNSEKTKGTKNKGFAKTLGSYAYRELENATANTGNEEMISDRVTGQSMKYIVRTPRYVKNVGKVSAATVAHGRFLSKAYRDMQDGALTGKEAGLMTLKRGGTSLKSMSKATISGIGRTIEEFHGSEDLGIEAVRKPKDVIVGTNKTLKVTSRAVNTLKQTPQKAKRTLRNMQKAAQKASQTIQYANHGIKAIGKALTNPAVLKSIAIGIAAIGAIMVAIAGISSISALFSSFTYLANDDVLSDTYAYITELDTDLAVEIESVPSDPKWSKIDKFHIYAFPPQTDPIPIISYLTVRYEDFKLNGAVKDEIDKIHSSLYKITYHEWTEEIKHRSSYTDSDGNSHSSTWTEYVYHLDVNMDTIPWQTYIMNNKDEMFPKEDDYAQYQTYNNVGGTTLRTELGFPFLGKSVYVSSRFGYRIHPISGNKEFHKGIDIPMPTGTPINATISGKVKTGNNGSYGKYVEITSGKRKTLYAHCNTIEVSNGARVKKGDVIATVGSTGSSTGSHLHLEFEKDGKTLNPFFYIEREQFAMGFSGGFAGAAASDEQFGAIIMEGEKYLGYPYVFGGKSPATSFDCSGFVSWVYTHSGVRSISADAQGLYNASVPVSLDEAKPGDLIFFQGTYNTPKTVTHVGIYVGNGMMLHCGNPIGYTSFNTNYWQNHFYGIGRLN